MAINVNPTRMEMTRLKARLKTAVRGHKLLKDKRDEMVRRFIELIRLNRSLRLHVEKELAAANKRFAVARAGMGNASVSEALYYPVRESHVVLHKRNIMSVHVPQFALAEEKESGNLPYSFAFTSSELDGAVLALADLLPALLELAEVEKACNMLAEEIEKTRRRVNALEYVMIPEMQENIRFIKMKLDENERGNLIRLMKVKEILEERA